MEQSQRIDRNNVVMVAMDHLRRAEALAVVGSAATAVTANPLHETAAVIADEVQDALTQLQQLPEAKNPQEIDIEDGDDVRALLSDVIGHLMRASKLLNQIWGVYARRE
jgi:phosphopantothenate synthetase